MHSQPSPFLKEFLGQLDPCLFKVFRPTNWIRYTVYYTLLQGRSYKLCLGCFLMVRTRIMQGFLCWPGDWEVTFKNNWFIPVGRFKKIPDLEKGKLSDKHWLACVLGGCSHYLNVVHLHGGLTCQCDICVGMHFLLYLLWLYLSVVSMNQSQCKTVPKPDYYSMTFPL